MKHNVSGFAKAAVATIWSLLILLLPSVTEACTVNVALACKTLSGASCGQIQPRTTNCAETIMWEISVRNTGAAALTVTSLDLTRGSSSTIPLVGSLPVNPIAAGASTGMSPRTDIDACRAGTYSANVVVAGRGQTTCGAEANASFTIRAASMPASMPAPRSVAGPFPVPTSGNCRVLCAPGFTCSSDGMSCARSAPTNLMPVPAPSPALMPRSMQVPVPAPVPRAVPAPRPPSMPSTGSCRVICATGFTCSADGMSCFRSGSGPVPTPTNLAPRAAPAPAPRAGPTSLPMVDCIVNTSIVCRRSNGSACNTLVPRTTNCQEAVTYDVSMKNNGNAAVTVTQATLTIDGRNVNFLTSVDRNPIPVGQTATSRTPATINVCGVSVVNFLARLSLSASPPAGTTCRPTAPMPAPVMMPTAPRPVMSPMTSPVPRTVVDCTVVPGLTCSLASNGQPCSSLVPRTTNCNETFRYRLSVQNTGTIALPIDTARILIGGGNAVDVLSRLSSNPVPVGSTATASTDVSINACGAFASSASIQVRVGQVPLQYICRNYIPQPSTIIIGGPTPAAPAPRPQPAPVPAPTTAQAQLVDCTIRSSLVSCEQANGGSCSGIVPPANCAPVPLVYTVRLQNAGSVQLTVTVANMRTAAGTNSLLSILPSNPLSVGQVSNIRVPVSLNVCPGNDVTASINVSAAPPRGYICR